MADQVSSGGDFAQFRKTFFEECVELLSDLEERLGRLQSETADSEDLNAIFRAVHSIKAGAGAFNFTQLVNFSHTFEALLDNLRSGSVAQDVRTKDVLIRAGDVLAALVEAAQQERGLASEYGADVAVELQEILDGATCHPPTVQESVAKAVEPVDGRFRILFKPHAELFRHANEPLLLIRELKTLGELTVECDLSGLPPLRSLEADSAYLSWVFQLRTDRSQSAIAEVFEFVDQDCDLSIESLTNGDAAEQLNPTAATSATATLIPSKPASDHEKAGATGGRPGVSSIRVDLARVDRLVNMVGELVITQAMLTQRFAEQGDRQGHQRVQGHEDLALRTRELQECVMAIRMQPVKSVFARMPRLVREVAGKLNKRVRLVTTGEQTEVDKTVIEELADPLTHMIRNAVDHGIEDPATRRAKGKPEEGTIELTAIHRGGNILIQISDDGAGINRGQLLRKAIEKGLAAEGANLSDEQIDNLIFAPGFSTAEQVTDVSGRGVGMDVVSRNINGLGGRVHVHSTPGQGTRFTLILPLTLAVLDGMLVAVGREKYILPLTSIVESIRPERGHVRALAGGGQVVAVRDEFIRLIYLCRIFDVAGAVTEPWNGLVVLVETDAGAKVGIVVDELIGQQQVVIKSLQTNFDRVPGIAGATILGDGRVALILDLDQLSGLAERQVNPLAAENRMLGGRNNDQDRAGNGPACGQISPEPSSIDPSVTVL